MGGFVALERVEMICYVQLNTCLKKASSLDFLFLGFEPSPTFGQPVWAAWVAGFSLGVGAWLGEDDPGNLG